MKSLDELRSEWKNKRDEEPVPGNYDAQSLHDIVKHRVKKHTGITMRYFWPAFIYQMLVYAMLSHVMLRYPLKPEIMWAGIAGIVLFIPFTWVLMKKFKAMATLRVGHRGIVTMHDYIMQQHALILSFFRFKQWYELILIPMASMIGVWIVFEIFVPGGAIGSFNGVLICLGLTLISCAWAIIRENTRMFREPLRELQKMIDDFKQV